MKLTKKLSTIVLISFFIFLGCDKIEEPTINPTDPDVNIDPDKPANPNPIASIVEIDVTVVLPTESINLAGLKILSGPNKVALSTNRTAKIEIEKNARNLVVLLDAADNPILLGFVTEQKKEISIRSTAEAVLFYRLGTVYLPEEIKVKFFEESSTLPNFEQFTGELTTQFLTDPRFLQTSAFQASSNAMYESLLGSANEVDVTTLRLLFDGDIRSGLQVEEKDGNNVVLVNTTRRRAHGFVYKVSSKDQDDRETILINSIEGQNSVTDKQVTISPKAGVTAFIGTLQNAAGGKGLENARIESDPINLPILENENAVNYKVRVVGPSIKEAGLTNEEEKKVSTLEYETLGLDVILPILLNVMGGDYFLKDLKQGGTKIYIAAFEKLIGLKNSLNYAL